jgi:PHP family Zn ribbon phosphoesterase
MHRVEELADRPEGYVPPGAIPCEHLVPLAEIIAEATGKGVDTVTVQSAYDHLIQRFGSEFHILMDLPEERLRAEFPERIGLGIIKMRRGQLHIRPGYDGVFGQVRIFGKGEEGEKCEQMSLF